MIIRMCNVFIRDIVFNLTSVKHYILKLVRVLEIFDNNLFVHWFYLSQIEVKCIQTFYNITQDIQDIYLEKDIQCLKE